MSAGRSGQRDNTLVQVSTDRPNAISPAVALRETFLLTSGPSERQRERPSHIKSVGASPRHRIRLAKREAGRADRRHRVIRRILRADPIYSRSNASPRGFYSDF